MRVGVSASFWWEKKYYPWGMIVASMMNLGRVILVCTVLQYSADERSMTSRVEKRSELKIVAVNEILLT